MHGDLSREREPADTKGMAAPAAAPGPSSLSALPGALLHCALLTALTVALAALTGWNATEVALRPLFIALLWSYLRTTGTRHPHIRGLPLRLCEAGFLVLTLASSASAVLTLLELAQPGTFAEQLSVACDRGAIFLLGFVLLAYGLLLWIPWCSKAIGNSKRRWSAPRANCTNPNPRALTWSRSSSRRIAWASLANSPPAWPTTCATH